MLKPLSLFGNFTGFLLFISTFCTSQNVSYEPLNTENDISSRVLDVSLAVGYTSGTHGVSSLGSATYSIPISIPKGTNGVEPSVALSYNSLTGNGIAGYGWNISGISMITRMNKVAYLHNEPDPIKNDNSDFYAIDGIPLLPIHGGINGADGTKYRKEQNDFSQITSFGNSGANTGPMKFEIITKEGLIMQFGWNASSQFHSESGGDVLFWALSKIIDPHGNYVEYIYENDHRHFRISSIKYTGNDNAGLLPYNEINFYYKNRNDLNKVYSGGASINLFYLLDKIDIISDGNFLKKYQLVYGWDNSSHNSYSYLNKIYEKSNALRYNSTLFHYGDPNNAGIQSQIFSYSTNGFQLSDRFDYIFMDINGDGYDDCVEFQKLLANNSSDEKYYVEFKVYINLKNGTFSQPTQIFNLSAIAPLHYFYANWAANNNVIGRNSSFPIGNLDFNGDGLMDLVFFELKPATGPGSANHQLLTNIHYFIADPSSSSFAKITIPFTSPFNKIKFGEVKEFLQIGDFDGNSTIDLILFLKDSYTNPYTPIIIFSNPGGNTTHQICNFSQVLTDIDNFEVIDFNGDGRNELLTLNEFNASIFEFMDLSCFAQATILYDSDNDGFSINKWSTYKIGDFNGDGKTDFLRHNGVTGSNSFFLVLSTGKKFEQIPINTNIPFDLIGDNKRWQSIKVGDYNGDNQSDLFWIYKDTSLIEHKANYAFSEGLGFNNTWKLIDLTWDIDINHPVISCDINGDGKTDEMVGSIIHVPGSNNNIYRQDIYSFNEKSIERNLTKISDGFNRITTFHFTPLTDPKEWIPQFSTYEKGTGLSFPYKHIQPSLQCVSHVTAPNGLGIGSGNFTTYYGYEDLVLDSKGKGLMGFRRIKTLNAQNWMVSTNGFELNSATIAKTFVPSFTKTERFDPTNTSNPFIQISETIYTSAAKSFGLGNPYGPNIYSVFNEYIESTDYLLNALTVTGNIYDVANGNLIETTSIIDPAANNNLGLEIYNTTTSYISAGGYGNLNKPELIQTESIRQQEDPYIRISEYSYNSNGYLEQQINDPGTAKQVESIYNYSPDFGNLEQTTINASGSGVTPSSSTSITYDSKGRFPISYENEMAQLSSVIYDSKWGGMISETSIAGLTTTYTYDDFGRLIETVPPYIYNSQNNPISASLHWDIGPGGSSSPTEVNNATYFMKTEQEGSPTVKIWYDKLERERKSETESFGLEPMVQITAYNALGLVETSTSPFFEPSGIGNVVITENTYDELQRIATVSNNAGTVEYDYTYDTQNKQFKTEITDAAGITSTQITDASGKIIEAIDNGGILSYTYYSNGNQQKVELDGLQTVYMEYDDYARQKLLEDANAGVTLYEYNALGQLESQTDANGNNFEWVYDALGREIMELGPDGPTVTSYVANGNGLNQTESVEKRNASNTATESMISYTYDDLQRLQNIIEEIDGEQFETQYYYDSYGNISSQIYPSGLPIFNSYNSAGYLTNISKGNGNHTTTLLYQVNEMDALGNIISYELGNGITTTKEYNNFGFPVSNLSPGILELETNFDLATGNLHSRSNITNPANTLTEVFSYDNLNRLTENWISAHGNQQLQNHITYNSFGNIQSKTDVGNYDYDPIKFHAVAHVDYPNQTVSDILQEIEYTNFHKTKEIKEEPFIQQFTYGPLQNRMKSVLLDFSTNDEIKTKYYATNFEKLVIHPDTEFELNYISGPSGLIGIYVKETDLNSGNATEQMYYTYTDYLVSILAVTDENANIMEEQNFGPWGQYRDPSNWSLNYSNSNLPWLERGFTGHKHMPEFSLVNMNGRIYDPVLGRMLSVDNYVQNPYSTQSYNRYSYVINNPLKYTDPSGELPVLATTLIGTVIGAGTGYAIGSIFDEPETGAIIGGILGTGIGLHLGLESNGLRGLDDLLLRRINTGTKLGPKIPKAPREYLVDKNSNTILRAQYERYRIWANDPSRALSQGQWNAIVRFQIEAINNITSLPINQMVNQNYQIYLGENVQSVNVTALSSISINPTFVTTTINVGNQVGWYNFGNATNYPIINSPRVDQINVTNVGMLQPLVIPPPGTPLPIFRFYLSIIK